MDSSSTPISARGGRKVRRLPGEHVTPALPAELAEHDLEKPGRRASCLPPQHRRERAGSASTGPSSTAASASGPVPPAPAGQRVRVLGRPRPGPDGHLGGADDHAARHRAQQGRVPAADRARRDGLRRRLLRARRRAPTCASLRHPRRPRGDDGGRRVGDQRGQDLEQRRPALHPRVALRPHRPRRPRSTGASRSSSCPSTTRA